MMPQAQTAAEPLTWRRPLAGKHGSSLEWQLGALLST
jgi:hypothetical protein